jgi:hypothetical protein
MKLSTTLLISLLILTGHKGWGQAPTQKIVISEADSLNGVLEREGVKVTHGNIIAWFPKDSLAPAEMERIVDTLHSGFQAVMSYIHAPLPWQLHTSESNYTFYFRPDKIVSHTNLEHAAITISLWRIKTGKSPWLHELVHAVLASKEVNLRHTDDQWPEWLIEGLADYLTIKVSQNNHIPYYDVMSNSSLTNVDSLFIINMGSEIGRRVLPFIGENKMMPELFSNDRRLYAPAFYHGSASFVNYIAEHYSLDVLLKAYSAVMDDQEIIKNMTNQSFLEIIQSWLDHLKIDLKTS